MNIKEGQIIEVQGSGKKPYEIKRVGTTISCSCPAWRNQSVSINQRTCKHIRKICGDEAETIRIGSTLSVMPTVPKNDIAVLLANKWTPDIDPTGWWMSEKLDGMRAVWTGKEFLSRQGNKVYTPKWFEKGFGAGKLDGELWMGRKMFQKTISITRTQGLDQEWQSIKYRIFDVPDLKEPFEVRINWMAGLRLPSHGEVVAQSRCTGMKNLQHQLKYVEALGGEGLMLREPGSYYESCRSSTLLKVKSFFDAEAVIVDHEPGKGRHLGKLGAYVVRMPGGLEFKVGTGLSDSDRINVLRTGTKITYRYTELTDGGCPRFPVFVAESIDR